MYDCSMKPGTRLFSNSNSQENVQLWRQFYTVCPDSQTFNVFQFTNDPRRIEEENLEDDGVNASKRIANVIFDLKDTGWTV